MNHEIYLTEVGSFSCIFGCLRFVWSAALDRYSYKIVYGTLLVIQILLAFTYYFAAKSRVLFALWVWLTIWCEGGHFTLVPNILKIIYGKHATSLYGVVFVYTGLCGTLMIGILRTRLSHEYIIFWMLTGGLSICSLIILQIVFN